jgi:hypothetical protein
VQMCKEEPEMSVFRRAEAKGPGTYIPSTRSCQTRVHQT